MEDISGNLRILALRTFQRSFDLLYFVGDYTTVDLMLRELQRIKRAPLFLTTAHLEDAYRLSKDRERFKNAYGVYPRTDPEFAPRFEKANGHKPKVLAAAGYDALRFLITAFRSKVDITAPEAKLSYRGVTGEHSLPPRGRGIAETQAVIAHIVGGELVEVTPTASEKP